MHITLCSNTIVGILDLSNGNNTNFIKEKINILG